jgi:hypothetical protein
MSSPAAAGRSSMSAVWDHPLWPTCAQMRSHCASGRPLRQYVTWTSKVGCSTAMRTPLVTGATTPPGPGANGAGDGGRGGGDDGRGAGGSCWKARTGSAARRERLRGSGGSAARRGATAARAPRAAPRAPHAA